MVEWFKAAVLKTAGAQAPEGSNPSLSAILSSQKPQKVPFGTVWGFHLIKTNYFQLYPGMNYGKRYGYSKNQSLDRNRL